MSDFKAKMHQIRFQLGSVPGPARGAYRPLGGFKGPTSKGRQGDEMKGRGGEESCSKVLEGDRRPYLQ